MAKIHNETVKKDNKNQIKQGIFSFVWNRIKYGVTLYCDTTSLHGFHYITDKNSSLVTRIFFACVSCCSLILCSYLINLQLFEHRERSIMTTVGTTAYPVWKVRFPSVSICNFNLVYKDNIKSVMNVAMTHGIEKEVFMDFVDNLSAMIDYSELENTSSSFKNVFDALQQGGYSVERMMAKFAQPCENMVTKCIWQSEEVPCSYIFETEKTSQGFCCSFNYYGTRETARKMQDHRNLRYQYVGGAGPTLGLKLFLNVEESQYVSPFRPSYGLNVLVQDGADYPEMDLMVNTLLTAEELKISVTPRLYISSANIKNLDIDRRLCLFEDEGDLEWSSVYSYKTCLTECKVNAILEYCKCIPYFYPVKKRERFCTLSDVPCLQTNQYEYSALGISQSYLSEGEILGESGRNDSIIECKCFPQCNQRMFDIHVDKAKASPMLGYEYSNMSILNVYYDTVGCIKTDRNVYYTWDRVFASVGGILGLCLGGSVISILECCYIFSKSLHRFTQNDETKPTLVKHADTTEQYISTLAYHHYGDNFGKKPFVNAKANMFAKEYRSN